MEHENQHHQQQSVPTLPTEIIVEILSRLPVESVLRCKSVCKLWCSLISDPHFVKTHLAMSTRNNHYRQHRLVLSTGQGEKLKTYSLHHVLYDNSINVVKLDYPFTHLIGTPKIMGSCNGLVCIAIRGVALFVWNPYTRKSNMLPPSGYEKQFGWYALYGFGYDESTDDYKVVELSCHAEIETLVRIYSLKNGNWKKIDAFPLGCPFLYNGKFCNGALHWAANKDLGSWTIVSLDLAQETYGEVLQPVYDAGYKDLKLESLSGWLCVLCNYHRIHVDLWVMKVYGMKDSWTKLASIPYYIGPWTDQCLMPLCISNNGKILLQFWLVGWSNFTVYDSKTGSFSEIQNFKNCQQASIFVESLVSPMPAAGLGDR